VICAYNDNAFEVMHVSPAFLVDRVESTGQIIKKFEVRQRTTQIVRPEDFIWLELSMVPEVERVFVERRGEAFQVMTVVNDRSPELRRRIFAREKAVIDELQQYDFDFDILTRMNHSLEDLVSMCDKPSYAR
jgi:hypothetical protein